ncbi:MAG TPA: MFS transporter, partial [Ktedonobacterales bacterium]|nr:MFS transporter [Ktedonobacterales bacterium]
RRAAFTGAALLSLIIGMTLIVALVMIPLFIGTLVDTSPADGAIQSGLALLRMTALVPVGAIAGGWLSTRFGCRISAVLGVLCASAGFWLMHLWPANVGWVQITSATVVAGLGYGLVIAPISTSALNAARATQAGVASSVVTALRMAGMILGLATVTTWGLARLRVLVAPVLKAGTVPDSSIITGALHELYVEIFAATALVTLLGVLPALLLWRRRAGEAGSDYESFVAPLV